MGKPFVLSLALGVLLAMSAAADPIKMTRGSLDDPDLMRVLREVYPDLGPSGKATRYNGVRVLPDAQDTDADKPASVELDLKGNEPYQATVSAGAARYRVVMVENLLLAAELAPRYRFLGGVAVQTDPGGPPGVSDAFMIAPDVLAILVVNAHHNSQEGFVDYMLLADVGGKLAPVYQGPSLYSLQSNDDRCERKAMIQRLEAFAPLPHRHDGYADLTLKVGEVNECHNGNKATKSTKRADAVLTWNASRHKYVGGERELGVLSPRP